MYTFFYFYCILYMYKLIRGENMKKAYLLDFQDYLEALNFKFTIQYYSNDTLKLNVENEDGEIQTIYEGSDDDTSAHVIDYQVHNFLCDYVQNILLSYDDLVITRYYSSWCGFVINGKIFNIEDYKDNYNAFLKDILRFVKDRKSVV